MYYRINLDRLDELWSSARISHSGMLELDIPERGNPAPAEDRTPHPSLGTETTAETTTKKARARNPLFDALCEVEGSNAEEAGKVSGGRIAGALRVIRIMTPDVTAEEIRRRAANYRASWPTVSITANALANNWAKFGTAHAIPQASNSRRLGDNSNISAYEELDRKMAAS